MISARDFDGICQILVKRFPRMLCYEFALNFSCYRKTGRLYDIDSMGIQSRDLTGDGYCKPIDNFLAAAFCENDILVFAHPDYHKKGKVIQSHFMCALDNTHFAGTNNADTSVSIRYSSTVSSAIQIIDRSQFSANALGSYLYKIDCSHVEAFTMQFQQPVQQGCCILL